MRVEIIFETHATSTDNEAGIATGWLDGELSELGKRQAAELGERHRAGDIAAVYTSDLRRAVRTAEIAFAGSNLPVHSDERLRECNYGSLNGRPTAEIEPIRASHLDDPFPRGESYREAVERVRTFLDDLPAGLDGKRIVVIGHRATLWALEVLVNGRALAELVHEQPEWQPGWHYVLTR